MSPSPILPYGCFFGDSESRKEVPGFSIECLTPVLGPADVPLHTHEQATLVLVLTGTYISSAAGAGFECDAPMLIYNPPHTTHRDRFKSLQGRFLAISIAKETLRHAAEYAALPGDAISITSPDALTTAMSLVRELQRWREMSPLLAEGICLELLGRIGRQDQSAGQASTWLERARQFLEDNCEGQIRIGDIAHAAGVHPVYFARTFRKSFRSTPSEYLTRCRLQKAAALLRETELSLAESALQAGFFDQSHFSRIFKRHFGVSPGAYRKLLGRNRVQVTPFSSTCTRANDC